MNSKKIDRFSLIAVGFLIAVTANPFFYETIHPIIIGTIFYGYHFFKKGNVFSEKIIFVFLFVTLIFLSQTFYAQIFRLQTFGGLILRLSLAYFVLGIIKNNFYILMSEFVYFFAKISLILYFLFFLFPALPPFLINNVTEYLQAPFSTEFRPHIIIFDFSSWSMNRFLNFGLNSGFYWEPGAHAIFLIYALTINFHFQKTFFTNKNLILILTILTTFSTTGYICLLILILYIILFSQNRGFKFFAFLFVLPLFFYFSFTLINNANFLGSKLISSYNEIDEDENRGSRFQSFKLDFDVWKENPFFGKDQLLSKSGDQLDFSIDLHRNNGLGILLSTYGIFAFVLYLFAVFKGLLIFQKKYIHNKNFTYLFYLFFLLTMFAMPMTLRPFFYAMALFPISKNKL